MWVSPAHCLCTILLTTGRCSVSYSVSCDAKTTAVKNQSDIYSEFKIFIFLHFLTEFRLRPRSCLSSDPCKQRVSFNPIVPLLAETLNAWGKQARNKKVSRHFYCAFELHGAVK